MNPLRVQEQEERTARARATPWFITPLPPEYQNRLANKAITGIWRVRDRSNLPAQAGGHHSHAVTRRENGNLPAPGLGQAGGAWDCDCLDFEFNPGLLCQHIEAVRLLIAGEIAAEVEPAYRFVGPQSQGVQLNAPQGQANEATQTQAPDQTYPPQREKGDAPVDTNQTPRWARQYDHADEMAPSYPFIQWVNDPNTLEPRQKAGLPGRVRPQTGGFARPVDQDFLSPGEPAVIHHREGGVTEVAFTQELTVAVLKTRFAWIKDGLRVPRYVEGARGKLQALCLLRVPSPNGDYDRVEGPVMLTFTGLAGSRFNAARGQFGKAARTATKGKAPAYAFWMTLKAGDVEMVGKTKKSPITNVVLGAEADPDRDYVGDEVVDSIPWPEIDKWANAWKHPGPNGDGTIEGAEAEGEPAEEEHNIPF